MRQKTQDTSSPDHSELQIDDLIQQLDSLADKLELQFHLIEPAFVELGALLETLHHTSTHFLEQSAENQRDAQDVGHFIQAFVAILPDNIQHLQLGDVARQRGEHVTAALREIAHWLKNAHNQLDLRIRVTEAGCIASIQIQQLTAISADLDHMCQHFHEQLNAALQRAPSSSLPNHSQAIVDRQLETATTLRNELAALAQMTNATAQLRSQLMELHDALSPHLDDSVDTTRILDRFATSYTMNSERQIHQKSESQATDNSDFQSIEFF